MNDQTIAGYFRTDLDTADTMHLLTDGELNFAAVQYDTWQELIECYGLAVEQMASFRFDGRKSCAEVMDRTMKLLRQRYDLPTPRAWLPVLKLLRKGGPLMAAPQSTSTTGEDNDSSLVFPPPEEVLTDGWSPICFVDSEHGSGLRLAADANPALKAACVDVARRRDPKEAPGGFDGALLYARELRAELHSQNIEIPAALGVIEADLIGRLKDYDPELRAERRRKGFDIDAILNDTASSAGAAA